MTGKRFSGSPRQRMWKMWILAGPLLGGLLPFQEGRAIIRSSPPPESRARRLQPRPQRKELQQVAGSGPERWLATDSVHVYHFDLDSGDFVAIQLEQKGLDVAARVLGPSLESLFLVDSLNGANGPELIPLLARRKGRYTVEITGNGPGKYGIHVEPKRKARRRDHGNYEGSVEFSRGMELAKGRQRERLQAEDFFAAALRAWTDSGFRAGQADALYRLGKLRLQRGAWRDSLTVMQRTAALYQGLRNPTQSALALNSLGLAHRALAEFDKSVTLYGRALKLARDLGAWKLTADILYNRGQTNAEAGRYEAALEDCEEALAMLRAHRDPAATAKVLNYLGRLYSSFEDTDTALDFHMEALGILRLHPDDELKAQVLTNLGDAYRKREDLDRAVSLYLSAIALTRASGVPDDLNTLNNLAAAYVQLGRFSEALSAAQRCAREFEHQSNFGSAAAAWTNVGWALSGMGQFPRAFTAFGEALRIARARVLSSIEASVYLGMAWTELRRDNPIAARRFIEQGLEFVEASRIKMRRQRLRVSYLAGRQDFYDLLVEILMEQHRRDPTKGYDLKAFEASERARSRSLLDDLEGKPVIPALSVRDVQRQVLGASDVLLEYFVGRERSFLWILTPSTFATRELPAPSRIVALAREVHGLLSTSDRIEDRSMAIHKATDLSRVLLGSVADSLSGKRLLIVAPPILQYISFAALPINTRRGQRATSWPAPWISRNELIVEPSATFLATLRRLRATRPQPTGLIAIVGDPVYSRDDDRLRSLTAATLRIRLSSLTRLRFSPHEIAAIEAQVQGAKHLVASGLNASRRRVLAGELAAYKYLHFSVHSALNVERPERSALVLSLLDKDGHDVDGYLRAEEIASLKLSADLVALSACKSGLGREMRGEGLIGLTQAFFAAGARRTIVSLWDVDDQATAKLMGRFYGHLLHDSLSPAASLQRAQEWMWKQSSWSSPAYWAGFVLEGDPE